MHPSEQKPLRPFRPSPIGCIRKDPAFAGAVSLCAINALGTVTADIFRSLLTEQKNRELSALFEETASAELLQFRSLWQLTLALGGNPPVCPPRTPNCTRFLRREGEAGRFCLPEASHAQHRKIAEECRRLSVQSRDPVLTSLLIAVLKEEERLLSLLSQSGF